MFRSVSLRSLAVLLAAATAACGSGTAPNDPGSDPTSPGASRTETRTVVPNTAPLSVSDLAAPPFGAGTGPLTADSARARALRIVAGTVVEVENKAERTLPVWEVKVRTAAGALVEIKFAQATGSVVEVEGKTGPFTYDFNPGTGFITLQRALTAAQAARPGTIYEYELELDDAKRWVYEVDVVAADGLWNVKLDASTGAVLRTKPKRDDDSRDDDDNRPDSADTDDDLGALPDSVRAVAQAMVPGFTLREAEGESKNGARVWKLEFVNAQGAEVEVVLLAGPVRLFEVEGEDGPFSYEVTPGNGLVAFSAARTAALAARAGQIEEWELERDDDGRWYYAFEIETTSDDYEVEVDATTGTVLRVKRD